MEGQLCRVPSPKSSERGLLLPTLSSAGSLRVQTDGSKSFLTHPDGRRTGQHTKDGAVWVRVLHMVWAEKASPVNVSW